MEFSAYVCKCLREDEEFILHRARASAAELPSVLLLIPASVRPSLESLKKIDNEYSFRDDLDATWAVRPLVLSQYNGQKALVFEDPGGEPLDHLIRGPMEIRQFLRIAVGLAAALSQVHKRKLIHKDVKPSNVLVESATGRVWLTGFGIASRLARERQSPQPPEFIAGTLPYMAPEQTGRMNRSIDSRCDLYAVGVTLYEMLTGTLPFTASDPMEWVHCHVARQPVPPIERLNSIPEPVSAIIMKLLAKTAEERYQTAVGAASDLRHCLAEWETHHRVEQFALGEHDMPDCLLIPERLYGRTTEINTLLASFERVVAGGRPELVLVSGYSGIGKSSVVNELHKPLVPPRGLFASGKFDQYKRDIPYATLAQAFQSLLRPLLSKSEAELSKWRDALREALDPNGQLIVDLVPELKLIIGEQAPVPELPPQDAQGRFQLVFRRFISVFTQEHPLALFLDDLQWLDAASLDLMEDLLTRPDVKHLMLIGAYRDNEVDSTHPLMRKLEAIRQAGAIVHDIVLAPLALEDLRQLVADSLHCDPERAEPLGILIHDKTTGNPFFAIQFFSALAEESLLTFDYDQAQWSWDLNCIHAKGYTDNVVDLMVGKLNRLPIETQMALQQLACLGNSADFPMLRMLYQDSNEEMHGQLWEAVRTGLIFRSEDSYRFLHDRVQEAAYSLIPKELRAGTHLRIGMLLAAQTPPKKLEEGIFEIVNQINRGSHLIASAEERSRAAELNLIAGRRAKNSTAYASALKYLATGRAMLSEKSWGDNYELIFSIEYLIAECELLTADMEAAENRLSMLAQRANSRHDIAIVTRLRLTLYTTLDRSDCGVEVFLEYLRRVGTDWPLRPTHDEVMREYDRIWSLVGSRQIEDLVDLPLLTDSDVLDVLDVFTEVVTPSLFFDENLCSLVICHMVNLSIEHGNCDAACFAYVWFAIIAGPRFSNYKDGFRFGQLGYELVEKRGLKRYQARTYMSFGNIVMPWAKHALGGRDLVRRAFDAAYRIGDLTFAAYSWNELITNFLTVGDSLAEVQPEAENGLAFAQRARFGLVVDLIVTQLGLIRTLRGLTPEFGCFNDEDFDEIRFEHHLASNPVLGLPQFWYWARKLQARFLANDYTSAVEASLNAQRLLWTSPSQFETAEFRFYGALSHAASWDSASPDDRLRHFEALVNHHKQLEMWAENCPENFENRAALVSAEIARIEGRAFEAMRLYKQAIRSAHANGFVHNEALAYEIAGRFYLAHGFDEIADAYLRGARYGYLRWGADGKVRHLDQLYPHLRKHEPARATTSTIVTPAELLDLATVIKVSQAVSGEMVLEKLIDRIMRAAIEHAGAERGLLILPRGDELQIEAEATTRGNDVTVHQRNASVTAGVLPESVVRYVMRTQESVILDDASSLDPFAADSYVTQCRIRSILCLPLINQKKLSGILYLENNLAPHIFTPDRVTVLKVLASQAAISLENTRLYRDLEDREGKIRRLVDANILGICIWNLEGAIFEANEAFLRMLQYDREDLVSGRVRWTDLAPAEWRDRDERAVTELKATGIYQPFEKEYFRKDGSRVPVLVAGALFEEGGSEGVSFALDLSEQKRAEEALRRSEAYLAEAQQLSRTGSFGWDVSSGEIYSSRETFRIFEFEPTGKVTVDLILQRTHPEDRIAVQQLIESVTQHRTAFDFEHRLLMPGGSVKHVHVVGRPSENESGFLEFIGAVTDVSERKRAEEERQAHLRLLESMDKINRAIQGTNDLNQMMSDVLDAVLSIFGCHRAWLGYPCDPESPSSRTVMERTRPDFPGACALGVDFPMDAQLAHFHRLVRASSHAVRFGAGSDNPWPTWIAKRFSVQSQIVMAVYPRVDKPYLFGLDECTHARMWTREEEQLFEAIGRRFADTLTSLLIMRNLQESEARLEEAERIAHVGYWARDLDTGLLTWSDETYRIFGLQPHERPIDLAGLQELIHPEDRHVMTRAVADALGAGVRYEAEYRVVRPNGELRFVHSRGDVKRNTSGRPNLMFGTIQDITERKHAEEERERLRQAQADLAHLNRVTTMGELTASLAHEIKQPLTAALTNAETCLDWLGRDHPDIQEGYDAASRTKSDISRAVDIINRTKALFKKGTPERAPVDMNELIQDMVILLGKEAKLNSITIRTELASNLPRISADRVQLQQVLMNLMVNAIDSMKTEATQRELTIKSEIADAQLVVSVSDVGIGLPPDIVDRIFDPFFTTKAQGTGMGLPISRSIVESHGGRLWATANSGNGATFRFTLPLVAAAHA